MPTRAIIAVCLALAALAGCTASGARPEGHDAGTAAASTQPDEPEPVRPGVLVARVDPDRLMATIAALPPSRSSRGGEANQRALVQTEAFLVQHLRMLGYEPEVLPIAAGGPEFEGAPERWSNIVVEVPGIGAAAGAGGAARPDGIPREVLILSAHFDSVPGSPGADDDGTGVAAILEIARILKGYRPARTIRLVLFNLEESNLGGSRDYCGRVVRPGLEAGVERVVGMVSLEMLGYFSDEPNSQGSPVRTLPDGSPAPTVGDFIAVTGLGVHQEFSGAFAGAMRRAAPGLKVLRADFFPIPIPDILRSDHAAFLALGVPAFMLTDTANYRNPNYHRASDSIATIDRERFALVVRGVLGAAIELAARVEQEGTEYRGTEPQRPKQEPGG